MWLKIVNFYVVAVTVFQWYHAPIGGPWDVSLHTSCRKASQASNIFVTLSYHNTTYFVIQCPVLNIKSVSFFFSLINDDTILMGVSQWYLLAVAIDLFSNIFSGTLGAGGISPSLNAF